MADLLDQVVEPSTPPGWRAPTAGEHVCSGCKGAACFGLGATWFCRACVPAGFLPGDRSAR
jgi:hypothetical protein